MTDLRMEGQRDRLRGRVRSTWAEVTDDDIDGAEGNMERLIGTIKEKTGDTLENIQQKIDDLLGDDKK